jgi:hypothetical protein
MSNEVVPNLSGSNVSAPHVSPPHVSPPNVSVSIGPALPAC